MDLVFKALADPTRRKLLDRLHADNGQTLGELCERVAMTRQAVTKHLVLLEQANLVARFPNVSVIDLRDILSTVKDIVDNVTLAITVVGGLVLFSGSLILIGAVSMTKFKRVYEAAILKTLGASSRLIAAMLLLEYGVLGAIAGTVGALGAIVLSWAIARFALELPWQATPVLTMTGILATAVFVAIVGVAASLDVLRHKPLATLRGE